MNYRNLKNTILLTDKPAKAGLILKENETELLKWTYSNHSGQLDRVNIIEDTFYKKLINGWTAVFFDIVEAKFISVIQHGNLHIWAMLGVRNHEDAITFQHTLYKNILMSVDDIERCCDLVIAYGIDWFPPKDEFILW